MRTIRVVGLRLLMSFVSNFLSFVSCWIIWGIRHYELAQYEADDIIGTLDKLAEQDGFDVTIVSGDKDLIQLTDEHTVVELSKKGVAEFEAFTPDYLMEKMGITPTQFIDLKALMVISRIISWGDQNW